MDGLVYILSCIDLRTRRPETYTIKDQQTTTIIKCFENAIATHGIPKAILAAKGSYFKSKLFQTFCKAYNFNTKRTSSYVPSTNGASKRFNEILIKVISKYLSQSNNRT